MNDEKCRDLLQVTQSYISARREPEFIEWFRNFDWNPGPRELPPDAAPAITHINSLDQEIEKQAITAEGAVIACVAASMESLCWRRSYTADDIDQYFLDNYCHVELVGTRGHFQSSTLAFGYVIYGPQLEYPQHWHVAEEIYIPMNSGSLWSRDGGEFVYRATGEFIFHESNMTHAMTMQETPLLALYVWRAPAGVEANLAQKPEIRL
jgi:hypothetical protein